MEYIQNGNHLFEIVKSVPKNYFIWNIGKNMTDGYLPLCEWMYPENPDDFSINTETLKAVRCADAQVVLRAIGGGQNTIQKMERYIKRYSNSKRMGTQQRVSRMKEAVKILYTIQFD